MVSFVSWSLALPRDSHRDPLDVCGTLRDASALCRDSHLAASPPTTRDHSLALRYLSYELLGCSPALAIPPPRLDPFVVVLAFCTLGLSSYFVIDLSLSSVFTSPILRIYSPVLYS